MDLQEWREQKESGITADADVQDAAVQEQNGVDQEYHDAPEYEESDAVTDDQEGVSDTLEPDEDIEVPEAQKTAFQKALEREKRKAEERVRLEIEEQYNPYKSFFDKLGINDPAAAMQAIEQQQREQQILEQAEQLAYEQGWTDEQARVWLETQQEQQRMRDEVHDLRVSAQINELADNPDYAGIKGMKEQIKQKITASGGALTAEEAYWALGGKQRAEQMKREAEQREIAKRSKGQRTVQQDGTAASTDKQLSPQLRSEAKRLGMSEQEAIRLQDMPNDLEGFRKWKQNQRRA